MSASNERYIDMHTHTTASDGSCSPEELVTMAKNTGLSAIAITDHDTVDGVEESLAAGEKLGVEIIVGIEISAEPDRGTLHILGYGFDHKDAHFNLVLKKLVDSRNTRNEYIVEKCQAEGFDVTLEEIESIAGGEIVGRPHFAKLFVEKGYTKTTQKAFDIYLKKGGRCYVDKVRLDLKTSTELIHGAGGIAVLAHPYTLDIPCKEDFKKHLSHLKDTGIKGMEVFYPKHTESQTAFYKKTAMEMDLFITGGSDFHGHNKPEIALGTNKSLKAVPYEYLQRIKESL